LRENYDDFERLLGAKISELNAKIAVSSGAANLPNNDGGSFKGSSKKFDDWIAFHEPKINLMQKTIKSMEEELQEKVSFAMVQSMIGQLNEEKQIAP